MNRWMLALITFANNPSGNRARRAFARRSGKRALTVLYAWSKKMNDGWLVKPVGTIDGKPIFLPTEAVTELEEEEIRTRA